MNSPMKDKDFDLVSTLYHALQGADLGRQYSSDAQSDQEAREFFDNVARQYADIAEQAKSLLKQKL